MRIGVLGAGSVGATLGKAWVRCRHEVMFGVRDVTAPKVQTLLAETGGIARAGTAAEVAVYSEIIALTLTWEAVPEVLQQIGDFDGKVLLDCTNPLVGNQLDAALDYAAATMFYAGDDAEAKRIAAQLASEMGFEPVDTGALSASRFLETVAGFWGQLAYSQGLGRNIAWRLLKR